MKIGTNVSWQYHVYDLSVKLNRANSCLFKMRKYVVKYKDTSILLFLSPTYYTAALSVLRIVALINIFNSSKPFRIMTSQAKNSHTSHLFKQSSIIKFHNKICLENIWFVSKSLIYHYQFLIHGLVFPQISIIMKPQVLHRVTSQNFFVRQIDMGSIK